MKYSVATHPYLTVFLVTAFILAVIAFIAAMSRRRPKAVTDSQTDPTPAQREIVNPLNNIVLTRSTISTMPVHTGGVNSAGAIGRVGNIKS